MHSLVSQRAARSATLASRTACPRGARVVPRRTELSRASAATDVAGVTTTTVDAPPATGIVEINQTNFYPTLEAAGDSLVVVDFFTDWCGPCKMIYPELVKMSEEFASSGVLFYKFNCNKSNKELGKQLAIKVAPTFHMYKRSQKVAEMTGARVEKLRGLVEEHM